MNLSEGQNCQVNICCSHCVAKLSILSAENERLREEAAKARQDRDEALTKWQGHQKNTPCSGCPGGHDTFWLTVIQSPQWAEWFKRNDTYDVPECEACGHISQGHFQAFLKFTAESSLAAMTAERDEALKSDPRMVELERIVGEAKLWVNKSPTAIRIAFDDLIAGCRRVLGMGKGG